MIEILFFIFLLSFFTSRASSIFCTPDQKECGDHGHCDELLDECVCSAKQWTRGMHGQADERHWGARSYHGRRCESVTHCPQPCQRGTCFGDECLCNRYEAIGSNCNEVCLSAARLLEAAEASAACVDGVGSLRLSLSNHTTTTAMLLLNMNDLIHRLAIESRRIKGVVSDATAGAICRASLRSLATASAHLCSSYSPSTLSIGFFLMLHDQRSNHSTAAASRQSSAGLGVFRLLLDALARPPHTLLVHVDAASSDAFYASVDRIIRLHRYANSVHLLKRRVDVIWSGASVMQAVVTGARELLRRNSQWRVFINLSGADFPIRSIEQAQAYLKAFVDAGKQLIWGNYVAAYDLEQRARLRQHTSSTFVECHATRAVQAQSHYIQSRSRSRQLYAQANAHMWAVLTRDFVQHLVYDVTTAARIINNHRLVRVADEKYLLTFLLNSPRYRHQWARVQSRFVRFEHDANHPHLLTLDNDYTRLRKQLNTSSNNNSNNNSNSSDNLLLFARKLSFGDVQSRRLIAQLMSDRQ